MISESSASLGTEGSQGIGWSIAGGSAFRSLPCQRWNQLLGSGNVESLISHGVFVPISPSMLDGRTDRYDLGFGEQRYEIQILSEGPRAFPEAGGEPILTTEDQIRVFEFSRARFIQLLARLNGTLPLRRVDLPEHLYSVGTISLNGKLAHWLIGFDQTALKSKAILLYLQELSASGDLVIVSLPGQKTLRSSQIQKHHILFTALPDSANGWLLDRTLFCRVDFGFRSNHVAAELYQFSRKILLIDDIEGAIFILGHRLDLAQGTRPYKYLTGLSRFPGSEIPFKWFATEILGHLERSDWQQRTYEDQDDVRGSVERAISEAELQANALRLFDSPGRGKLRLPLSLDEILYWGSEETSDSK